MLDNSPFVSYITYVSDLIKLSVSKVKCFKDCKKKYNYRYNLKLPQKDWMHLALGKFLHQVLETFHLAYLNGSEKPYNIEMGVAWKTSFKEYKKNLDGEAKKEAWEIISQYLQLLYKNNNRIQDTILAVEKPFQVNIDNRIILNGAIDRIQVDTSDGVLHLADYKSTKNENYLKNDFFQLLTYAYVMLVEDPSIEKIRASYWLLRHNHQLITEVFQRDEILKVKNIYLDYIDKIEKEKDFNSNPTFLCTYCDFLEKCEDGKRHLKIFNGETTW